MGVFTDFYVFICRWTKEQAKLSMTIQFDNNSIIRIIRTIPPLLLQYFGRIWQALLFHFHWVTSSLIIQITPENGTSMASMEWAIIKSV